MGTEALSLAARMCAIRGELEQLPKDGRMKMGGQEIHYVKNDDLQEAIRKVFARHGVHLNISMDPDRPPQKVDGGWLVWVRFRLVSIEGETEESWYTGLSPNMAAAQTFARKYWEQGTLMLSGGDDDDECAQVEQRPARRDREREQPRRQQQPARQERPREAAEADVEAECKKVRSQIAMLWPQCFETEADYRAWLFEKKLAPYDEVAGKCSTKLLKGTDGLSRLRRIKALLEAGIARRKGAADAA